MTPAVSVVIPTFNGARRLPLVLGALAEQDVADGSFEVIVVDNNSTDDSARVAVEDPAAVALRARRVDVRCIRESRQGPGFARIAGLLAARAALLCFLDDDNIPAPDYLRCGIVALDDPSVGILGSRLTAQWEIEPPPSIARRRGLLAINDFFSDSPDDFGASASIAPTMGAGMWVRREAFMAAVPLEQIDLLLPGRTANSMCAAEDIELGMLIGVAGYRRLYLPQLRIAHVISKNRVTTPYFCRLIVGHVPTNFTLESRHRIRSYTLARRMGGALRLVGALAAAPAVAVVRKDGLREALFIIAQRWAAVRGPYSAFARPLPGSILERHAQCQKGRLPQAARDGKPAARFCLIGKQ
jgi:cellulose synthase/poly-beta-1,6-N-acetylglucosamine synthase-like glycosyltransferase